MSDEMKIKVGIGKFVTMTPYQGLYNCHVRYYDIDPLTGKQYPTRKGILMAPTDFANMMKLLPKIKMEMEKKGGQEGEVNRVHVSSGIYATTKMGKTIVDFRHFFLPADSEIPVPTKRGIFLNKVEMQEMEMAFDSIRARYPEFDNAQSNVCDGNHFEPDNGVNCKYCHPFGPPK